MGIKYRPEIDGLRAIAVGAVILYHAQIDIFGHQPFKGGFIGVDIFFVISGYLITSIILKELVTTGTFSFKHFYERRIRRILPALLFVMLASLPFAWMYLLPNALIDFSKSILYSLGFSSNFYFHYSGQQYGAESGLFKPFLHTWSLSVEEQYYILFPIVLLITFKYFRKYLVHILILGFVISLGLAEWTSRNYPSASFYFLHTRMWELLAGSLLAYFEITNGHRSKNKILNLILPTIGLILIGHSILFFNDEIFHPSFYTLSPIIGVCLIIWFSNKDELITKILSTKLFVGIGLISYSLYLWHYPIFAFNRVNGFTGADLTNKLLLALLILTLSLISYTLVEKKFRNKNFRFKKITYLLFFCFLLNLSLNFWFIKQNGFYDHLPNIFKTSISKNSSSWSLLKNEKDEICHNLDEICSFEINNGNKKVYLIGDSIMASLSYDLKQKLNKSKYSFYSFTKSGCPFFENGMIVDDFDKIYKKCNEENTFKRNNFLMNNTDKIIIIGARHPLYLNETRITNSGEKKGNHYFKSNIYKNYEESFLKGVKQLLTYQNNYVILLTPLPELEFNLTDKIQQEIKFNRLTIKNRSFNLKNKIFLDKKNHNQRTKNSNNMLNKFKNYKNITILNLDSVFCKSNDICYLMDNESYFFEDPIHPSLKGSKMINDLIMKEIEKIILLHN